MTSTTSLLAPSMSGARRLCLQPGANLYVTSTSSSVGTLTINQGNATAETVSFVPEASCSNQITILGGGMLYDHGAGETVTLSGT